MLAVLVTLIVFDLVGVTLGVPLLLLVEVMVLVLLVGLVLVGVLVWLAVRE